MANSPKARPAANVQPIVAMPEHLPISFEDAVQQYGGEMVELPSDWRLTQKESLLGVPFFVYGFRFNDGDQGQFASVYVVTEDDRRLVFNDGGTGIVPQLKDFVEREHKMGGLVCRNGLRQSEFYFDPETKETFNEPRPGAKKASTFYLT